MRSIAVLLVVLSLAPTGCGSKDEGPSLVGAWTSRPKAHSESKESVEFFGEGAVQRLHDLGNAATPPVRLELRRDGGFDVHGKLTSHGTETGHAWGTWRRQSSGARLTVSGSENAPGLAAMLIVPAEGISLTWGAAPKRAASAEGAESDDEEVALFRE